MRHVPASTEENALALLYFPLALGLIILLTAWRLFVLHGTFAGVHLPLSFDEAQYWAWAQDPAWGYFSKPPVIAWLMHLSTEWCGSDSAFCIRFFAPVLHGFTALMVWGIARHIFGAQTALWSCLVYLLLPGVSFSSIIFSTDAPLMACWALATFAFLRVLENSRHVKWWIMFTLACGLGLLSKYTMVLFGASVGLYLISSHASRPMFLKPFFWLSVAGALLLFLPNILWNFEHDWISFMHTQTNVFSFGFGLQLKKGLEFLLGQFGVVGPFFLVLMVVAPGILRWAKEEEEYRLLTIFTFLPILAGVLVAFISGAQAHWSAPAYITGSIMIAYFLQQTPFLQIMRKVVLLLHAAVLVIGLHYTPIASAFGLPALPMERLERWHALTRPSALYLHEQQDAFLLTDERKAAAILGWSLRSKEGKPYPVLKWNPNHYVHDHYDMTTNLNNYIGRNMILVTRHRTPADMAPYFIGWQEINQHTIANQTFRWIYLVGFKGY